MTKENKKQRNQTILFVVVLVYVFAFMFWWSFLLFRKTVQHHVDTQALQELQFISEGRTKEDYLGSELYEELHLDLRKEKRMIITEGIVFIIILSFGMAKVRQSFVREIEVTKQQRNFILSITHELKSPISSIRLMSETMVKRDLEKPLQHKLLKNSIEESVRLENLVENILLATKIDSKQYGFAKETQNVSVLIHNICEQFTIAKGITVLKSIAPNVEIKGDKSALTSVIVNLLENAYKYAPDSEHIEVRLKEKGSTIILEIKDQGNGVADEEKEKIFQKFYRTGNEDTRKAKGTGLGLYIVKELVEYHHGEIAVLDNDPKGAVFRATFHV